MKKVVPLEGFGGGGSSLNFKIIAYATEEELIAAQPKENTIGIITDIPIAGYRFSATEPENIAEGIVWIETGSDSRVSFDVVNNIKIYPISAQQYVSGIWVKKIAYSYQGNEWKPLFSQVYVFKSGEGALETITTKADSGNFYVTISDEHIFGRGYVSSTEASYVSFYTALKDLTGYSTLYFDVEVTKAWSGEEPRFGVASTTIPASASGINKFVANKVLGESSRQTISIDISDIDSGYIGAWACGNFYVYNIWYE